MFLKFLKNLENSLSRKVKGFGNSYIESRIAKPGKTLTISYYWVANYKLDEINTEFKLENRKKKRNHCNIRYSLNVKKFFS